MKNKKYKGVYELEEEEQGIEFNYHLTAQTAYSFGTGSLSQRNYYSQEPYSSSSSSSWSDESECCDTEDYEYESNKSYSKPKKHRKKKEEDNSNYYKNDQLTNLNEDKKNELKFLGYAEEIENILKEKSMNVLRLRTLATLSDLKEIFSKNMNSIKKLSFDEEAIKQYQEANLNILEETKELYETISSYTETAKPESLKSYISAFKSLFH